MESKGNLLICIYSHPEYYPPTLNAIEYLAGVYDKIYIVHRNLTGFDWVYPANVVLIPSGELLSPAEAQAIGFKEKLQTFFKFTKLLLETVNKHRVETMLVYDYMPLLSYRLIRRLLHKSPDLWYHNHDVADKENLRKWSISWWAWKTENWIFPRLALFSLPAIERKAYFPMGKFKGKFFFIPNFPAKKYTTIFI
jgi:hypothetical protein